MKKICLILILLLISSFSVGCGLSIEGVWYGLDGCNDGEIYDSNKIVFKENNTYISNNVGSGEYHVADNTVFLESNDNDTLIDDLSIMASSEAAKLLGFKDKSLGKVLVSSMDAGEGEFYTLYYPTKKERDKAKEKIQEQTEEKLREALKDSGWFTMGVYSDGEYLDFLESGNGYLCAIYRNNKYKVYWYGEKDDASVYDYEIVNYNTFRITNESGEAEEYEIYLNEYEYDGQTMQELNFRFESDGVSYSEYSYNMDNLKSKKWKDEYVYGSNW